MKQLGKRIGKRALALFLCLIIMVSSSLSASAVVDISSGGGGILGKLILNVSKSKLEFDYNKYGEGWGQSITVSGLGASKSKVTTSDYWIHAERSGKSVYIYVNYNIMGPERTGKVSITSLGVKQSITVFQKGDPLKFSTFTTPLKDEIPLIKKSSVATFFGYDETQLFSQAANSISRNDLYLAHPSICLSAMAYDGAAMAGFELSSFLGFTDIHAYNYKTNDKTIAEQDMTKIITAHPRDYSSDDRDFCAFTLACKKINVNKKEYNLVAVVIRGSKGSETDNKDWISNFDVGNYKTTGNHEGFFASAADLEATLAQYLKAHPSFKASNTKIWLTGHSRGGAVANIVARDLTEGEIRSKQNQSISKVRYATADNVYACCFAAPAITRNAKSYVNIMNYCNDHDIMTTFFTQSPFSFKRFGRDVHYGYDYYPSLNNGKPEEEWDQFGDLIFGFIVGNMKKGINGKNVFDKKYQNNCGYLKHQDFVNNSKQLEQKIIEYVDAAKDDRTLKPALLQKLVSDLSPFLFVSANPITNLPSTIIALGVIIDPGINIYQYVAVNHCADNYHAYIVKQLYCPNQPASAGSLQNTMQYR